MPSDPKVTAALVSSIVAAGKNTAVTETTRQEIIAECGIDVVTLGVNVYPDIKDNPSKDQVVACLRWEPGKELELPENKTAMCSWGCGHMVQFRPHWPEAVAKACLQCIDQRPIKEN